MPAESRVTWHPRFFISYGSLYEHATIPSRRGPSKPPTQIRPAGSAGRRLSTMSLKDYKPIGIEDKPVFDRFFREDSPQISEMTFTNLFMWRHHYRPVWQERHGCLFILLRAAEGSIFGVPPVGTGDKPEALAFLCENIAEVTQNVQIGRAGEAFVTTQVDSALYTCVPDRDNSDYVYLTQDLIRLPGNKYHRKKNHLNQFLKRYDFEYKALNADLIGQVLEMQESWCRMKECVLNPALLAEDFAVREALMHFEHLGFQGGAILIDSRVEAFTFGEALNRDTAVIHIEKANPEIHGLYAAINQAFCNAACSGFTYVNREQDMGVEGLRKAKESYYPHHMVNKHTVKPKT